MTYQYTQEHDAQTQDALDSAAVRQAALDYVQGWYKADVERMRRCLHPELAKRVIRRDPETGEMRLYHLTQPQMIAKTQAGGGAEEAPRDKLYYDVSVLGCLWRHSLRQGGVVRVRRLSAHGTL
jgi:hypothetical protein